LITGHLFVQALIGVDPLPYRDPPDAPARAAGTMAFHAFFRILLITGTGLLFANWYGAMGRLGAESTLDQQIGGGTPGASEIPTITRHHGGGHVVEERCERCQAPRPQSRTRR
jgi:putative copper resistance protein D